MLVALGEIVVEELRDYVAAVVGVGYANLPLSA
jgi:hypothetical protein